MPKKKKGGRYTPPKVKSDRHKPWWERRIYRHSGNKEDYFLRVCEYLTMGSVDESKLLKVKDNRTIVHY